jgi:hypothetical protein
MDDFPVAGAKNEQEARCERLAGRVVDGIELVPGDDHFGFGGVMHTHVAKASAACVHRGRRRLPRKSRRGVSILDKVVRRVGSGRRGHRSRGYAQ